MKNRTAWIVGFISIWIIAVVSLSAWDQSMLVIANIFFSAITVLVLLIFSISKALVKLGVVIGRGNSLGGVGLVLAFIGFSIELIQLA